MNLVFVVGRDYPNTDREFVAVLPDDQACATYLTQLHWPGGFICLACERVSTPWSQSRGRLVCPASVTKPLSLQARSSTRQAPS
jgi:hypothetical protein